MKTPIFIVLLAALLGGCYLRIDGALLQTENNEVSKDETIQAQPVE